MLHLPLGISSTAGHEAVDLAESAGLVLDSWQRFAVNTILAEREDGRWAAFEAALVVPRQNGKGSILECIELASLFLLDEELCLHSAHVFNTAWEAFLRISSLIEGSDDLRRKVRQIRKSHADVSIELLNGRRLRFVARTKGSGRGFSADRVILDEAYNLGDAQMAALLPTLSARPNPQIVYTSSAPMATSDQLHAVRRRALSGIREPGGAVGSLAYLEWSIDPTSDQRDDPAAWARANPGMGIRVREEFVRNELAALSPAEFDRERLGVPDDPEGESGGPIPLAAWQACLDTGSRADRVVAWAVDVSPDRAWSSIAFAGVRGDGLVHVEADRRPGTDWVPAAVEELRGEHGGRVLLDPSGPAGTLVDLIPGVETVSAREHAQACGSLHDAVVTGQLRHVGQSVLDEALRGAVCRPLGDAWAWGRVRSTVDISSLVAVTLAYGAVARSGDPLQAVW